MLAPVSVLEPHRVEEERPDGEAKVEEEDRSPASGEVILARLVIFVVPESS